MEVRIEKECSVFDEDPMAIARSLLQRRSHTTAILYSVRSSASTLSQQAIKAPGAVEQTRSRANFPISLASSPCDSERLPPVLLSCRVSPARRAPTH
jgi:hypothetical protein